MKSNIPRKKQNHPGKAKNPTLRSLGEFGLLKRLRARAPTLPPGILRGMGDDTAIIQLSPGLAMVATVDVLVEKQDFHWDWCPPEAVGQKGVTVSLSDVGAMGAVPQYALVALGLPPTISLRTVDRLYRGIWETAEATGVAVVGGDLSEAPCLILSVTVIGEGESDRLVRRSGSKAGETIWVSGPLGGAAAGLRALQAGYRIERLSVVHRRGRKISPKIRDAIRETIRAQLYPVARHREGRILAEHGLATAMIDLSDGLASDLQRLTEESNVGARIFAERIPLEASTIQVAGLLGLDPVKLAIGGGEDFELLFTSRAEPAAIEETLLQCGFVRPYPVGETLPAKHGLFLIGPRGRQQPIRRGFEHFR